MLSNKPQFNKHNKIELMYCKKMKLRTSTIMKKSNSKSMLSRKRDQRKRI